MQHLGPDLTIVFFTITVGIFVYLIVSARPAKQAPLAPEPRYYSLSAEALASQIDEIITSQFPAIESQHIWIFDRNLTGLRTNVYSIRFLRIGGECQNYRRYHLEMQLNVAVRNFSYGSRLVISYDHREQLDVGKTIIEKTMGRIFDQLAAYEVEPEIELCHAAR